MAKHDTNPVLVYLVRVVNESGRARVPVTVSAQGAVVTGVLIARLPTSRSLSTAGPQGLPLPPTATRGLSPAVRRIGEQISQQKEEALVATGKQVKTARKNISKAREAAASKRTIAHLPKQTRSELGKQGAAVARRNRAGGDSPKTRAELYEIAKRRDLPGRSTNGTSRVGARLGEE